MERSRVQLSVFRPLLNVISPVVGEAAATNVEIHGTYLVWRDQWHNAIAMPAVTLAFIKSYFVQLSFNWISLNLTCTCQRALANDLQRGFNKIYVRNVYNTIFHHYIFYTKSFAKRVWPANIHMRVTHNVNRSFTRTHMYIRLNSSFNWQRNFVPSFVTSSTESTESKIKTK